MPPPCPEVFATLKFGGDLISPPATACSTLGKNAFIWGTTVLSCNVDANYETLGHGI